MTQPLAITAMAEVQTRLQGIAVASGYLTDLGATLRIGWPQHLLVREQVGLPLLALHPGSDSVLERRDAKARCQREIAVEVLIDPHDTAPEFLDLALHDIRRALVGLGDDLGGVTAVEHGQAAWDEPGEGGFLARLTMPLTITYVATYGV